MARFVRPVRGKPASLLTRRLKLHSFLVLWKVKGLCSAIHRQEGETKCHCHRLPLWFRRLPDRLGEEPEVKVFRGLPRFLRECTGVALSSCLNTFSAERKTN
ncbi:hypothetical protein AVEN_241495-1 [Araneus ventricosus]|uniref:Uncharacterized protein n=1 Tax=Araneus ventricosus TaxID=182803 RepID=A0A4Y2FIM0_ARAVE|nr:hypothetical protein AVEN_241495-1 [Araneus ventricosus]